MSFRVDRCFRLVVMLLPVFVLSPAAEVRPGWMKVSFEGRTVHNSHYLAASFLYQLQTLLGPTQDSPGVLDGKIIRRQGKDLYTDLDLIAPTAASTLRDIARRESPEESIDSQDMAA